MNKKEHIIPIAIVFAGLLVSFAIFWGGWDRSSVAVGLGGDTEFRIPSEEDHIKGNRDAAITIVEFSDFQCSFCKRLHPTIERVVEENPDVKWVYRHFPLSSHGESFAAAIASECVAKLAGNDAFWDYTDSAFENQRSIGSKFYASFAESKGINSGEFERCLDNGNIASEVQMDLDEVIAAGGRGTPFSVIITASGEAIPFSGALPFENIMSLIERARNN